MTPLPTTHDRDLLPEDRMFRFRQFLRDPMHRILEPLWSYPERVAHIYEAYPGSAVHCCLEANRLACSYEHKKSRAQFHCEPSTEPNLLRIYKLPYNVPPNIRIKPEPILNYLPKPSEIPGYADAPYHRILHPFPDDRLIPMLKLSLDSWASRNDKTAQYTFAEDRLPDGRISLRVKRNTIIQSHT